MDTTEIDTPENTGTGSRADSDSTTTKDPIVDMNRRIARSRFAPLGQIEAYWNTLRGTRQVPLRSEIDPRGLKGTLEYCFVLERIAPGLARMRVAGSHLGDLMGMEVRGMPISSFIDTDSREEFGKALEEVFQRPATAEIYLSGLTSHGRPELPARMVLLPVKSDLGDISRIIGGFVTHGDIGRYPRRFKVDMIKINSISGLDDAPVADTATTQDNGFRPATAPRVRRPGGPKLPDYPVNKIREFKGMDETGQTFRQARPDVPYLRVVK